MRSFLKEALQLHELSYRVIPIATNKRPACGSWKQYQEKQTREDIESLFKRDCMGIALLTGDNVEVLDIDSKYALDKVKFENDVFDMLYDALGEERFNDIVVSRTTNGGYHVFYTTAVAEGNLKLASRATLLSEKKNPNDNTRVLLETRGEGGYVLIPPTDGYAFDKPNRTLFDLPFYDDKTRNRLILLCRSFNEVSDVAARSKVRVDDKVDSEGRTTIEEYNEKQSIPDLIEAAGWKYANTRGVNEYYVRAGKEIRDGISASFSTDKNLLYIFTTSTVFENEKAYNPFQVYAFLHHEGDYSAAAKKLYASGYGARMKSTTNKQQLELISSGTEEQKTMVTDTTLMEKIFNNERFDIKIKPQVNPSTLEMWNESPNVNQRKWVGIGGDGDLVTFLGLQKSRKSAIASAAASCFLDGGNREAVGRFRSTAQAGRALIHLDTEQGEFEYWKTCAEMQRQQGIAGKYNVSNFYSYRLTNYTMQQKVQYLEYITSKIDNIGCVFLDGIVDLCGDYNDQKESRALVEYVRRMASKKKFLLISVLHNARSTGRARGHLGTELLNKGKCNINITKEKEANYSTLEIDDLRGSVEPEGFDFTHNDLGQLVLY